MTIYFSSLSHRGTTIDLSKIQICTLDIIIFRIKELVLQKRFQRSEKANRKEIVERLEKLRWFFTGKYYLACNANWNKMSELPQYNWGYVYVDGEIKVITFSDMGVESRSTVDTYDITRYTLIPILGK